MKPSLLFVAGAGRSGSTLLGAMCGQVDGFVSVGELRHLWERGFQRNELCGCGRPFRECPFWREMAARASIDRDLARYLRGLQRRVDRMWRIPQLARRRVEGSLRAAVAEYARALEAVYATVGDMAGAGVVVDSSKSPSHVFVLHAAGGFDVRVLHLVRDSRAVAFSWRRVRDRPEAPGQAMPRYLAARAALEWDVMNAAAERVRRLRIPYTRVRYEDLVRRPVDVVGAALDTLGLPHGQLEFVVDGQVRLQPSHTVSGNPSRFETGTVTLRPDIEWRQWMSPGSRAVVTALTWPLLRRYGYQGDVEP